MNVVKVLAFPVEIGPYLVRVLRWHQQKMDIGKSPCTKCAPIVLVEDQGILKGDLSL